MSIESAIARRVMTKVWTQKTWISLIPKSYLKRAREVMRKIRETREEQVVNRINLRMNLLEIRLSFMRLKRLSTELLGIWILIADCSKSVIWFPYFYELFVTYKETELSNILGISISFLPVKAVLIDLFLSPTTKLYLCKAYAFAITSKCFNILSNSSIFFIRWF